MGGSAHSCLWVQAEGAAPSWDLFSGRWQKARGQGRGGSRGSPLAGRHADSRAHARLGSAQGAGLWHPTEQGRVRAGGTAVPSVSSALPLPSHGGALHRALVGSGLPRVGLHGTSGHLPCGLPSLREAMCWALVPGQLSDQQRGEVSTRTSSRARAWRTWQRAAGLREGHPLWSQARPWGKVASELGPEHWAEVQQVQRPRLAGGCALRAGLSLPSELSPGHGEGRLPRPGRSPTPPSLRTPQEGPPCLLASLRLCCPPSCRPRREPGWPVDV